VRNAANRWRVAISTRRRPMPIPRRFDARQLTVVLLTAGAAAVSACAFAACATSAGPVASAAPMTRRSDIDLVLRGGTVYDGSGGAPFTGDVAIRGDRVVAVDTGGRRGFRGTREVDARGMAVAPGFINMMSSHAALFVDGRAQSDVRQGVTLEVMGEGSSIGSRARSRATCGSP